MESRNFAYPISSVIIAACALFLATIALLNYLSFYSPDWFVSWDAPNWWRWLLWMALYIVAYTLSFSVGWSWEDIGFTHNWKTLWVSLAILFLLAPLLFADSYQISWQGAAIEAFARTGEEVFFRGFLFLLCLKIFEKRSMPWAWAIGVSSLLFAMVHTQVFQPGYWQNDGVGLSVYKIVEKLFNIMLIAALAASLRYWTHSLLGGIILHCVLNGGARTLPFCLAIYLLLTATRPFQRIIGSSTKGCFFH